MTGLQTGLIKNSPGIVILIILQFAICSPNCYAGNKDSAEQGYNRLQLGNRLMFIPNRGQIVDMDRHLRPDVLYKGMGGGADIYLRKTGISYVYTNIRTKDTSNKEKVYNLHRVDMDFVGCNNTITTINEDEGEGYNNYYLAQCPNGVMNVKQYKKVTFKNVYDNIDVVYHGSGEQTFKYDIIVKPGADAKQVKLKWSGAENMYINNAGNLVIKTSANEFYESIPKVYQEINGQTILVKAYYVLKSSRSPFNSEVVTFRIGDYNHDFPLIIDPLTWITYFGGNMEDFGASVATDGQHNAIFEGYTESPNLPVSPGAFQTAMDGASDGFVAKFNAAGTRLWATYIGGSDKDEARGGVAIDANNNIYISSVTWSTDFPTKAWGGAFMQLVNNSPNNGTAYIAQFTPAGALTWATYYGGSTADWGGGVAIDKSGNILFTGQTSSANFPVLNAYQPNLKGAANAFIVKFNNVGVRQWATYYGGSGSEQTWGIATDTADNIYVCGKTTSNNFPVVAAHQGIYGGGADDAFLIKLNTVNGNPIWSTYYGGPGDDWGTAVTTDVAGDVFLGLYTTSLTDISTAGSFQPVYGGGGYDGGIIKFTNAGTRVWGTYLGGNQTDIVSGFAIDIHNNISVAGTTSSTNFPVNTCAFQTTLQGSNAIFLSKFNQQDQLLCSGLIDYCGTGLSIGGNAVALDGVWAYIDGSSPGSLPVTSGCFQSVYGGNPIDAAFIKMCSYSCDTAGGVSVLANFNEVPATPCTGEPVNFTLSNTSCDTASTTYSWSFTGGTPAISAVQNPTGISWSSSGSHSISVKIVSPCDSITVNNSITVPPGITANVSSTNASCGNNNGSATITNVSGGTSPYTYSWVSSGGTNATLNNLSAGTYTCIVTDHNGCSQTMNVTINASHSLTITISPNVTIDSGQTTVLSSTGGGTYMWMPLTGLSCFSCPNPTATPSLTTRYCVVVDSAGCKDSACVTVTVDTLDVKLPCSDFSVPNVFTPNYAGPLEENNVFYIKTENPSSWSVVIYDRWGKEVFKSSNPIEYWDGSTESGGQAPAGVYYYIINATCPGNTYKKEGFVQLIR